MVQLLNTKSKSHKIDDNDDNDATPSYGIVGTNSGWVPSKRLCKDVKTLVDWVWVKPVG